MDVIIIRRVARVIVAAAIIIVQTNQL